MSLRWARRPTKPADPDAAAVTIGCHVQNTGTKDLHFLRALPGVPPPAPKFLLQDVRATRCEPKHLCPAAGSSALSCHNLFANSCPKCSEGFNGERAVMPLKEK
ncbi:hypothetical protein PENSPDRAFT_656714, partial [Peniophora sp. CONT]